MTDWSIMCAYGTTVTKRLPDFVQAAEQRISEVVYIDSCLSDLVDVLWAAGVVTRSVCCGHGSCGPDIMVRQRDSAKAREICGVRAVVTYEVGS